MEAKLVVVGGEAKAAEVILKLPTIIGRGRDVSLTLPHPLVSRQHCEIFESDGRLFVRDLGSLNGTFVNNEKLEGERELPAGNLLTIGTVTFRAVYDDGAASPAGDQQPAAKAQQASDSNTVAPNAATVQVSDNTPLDATLANIPRSESATNGDEADAELFDFEEVDEIEEVEEVDGDALEFSEETSSEDEAASSTDVADDDFLDTFLKDLE